MLPLLIITQPARVSWSTWKTKRSSGNSKQQQNLRWFIVASITSCIYNWIYRSTVKFISIHRQVVFLPLIVVCLSCASLETAAQLIGFGSFRRCHRPLHRCFTRKWPYTTWNHHSTTKNRPIKCTYGKRIEINLNHGNHVASSISNKLLGNLRLHLGTIIYIGLHQKMNILCVDPFKRLKIETFVTTHVCLRTRIRLSFHIFYWFYSCSTHSLILCNWQSVYFRCIRVQLRGNSI